MTGFVFLPPDVWVVPEEVAAVCAVTDVSCDVYLRGAPTVARVSLGAREAVQRLVDAINDQ